MPGWGLGGSGGGGTGGGGGGSVNSVAAGNGTVTIGGTATDPTVVVSSATIGTISDAQADATNAAAAAAAAQSTANDAMPSATLAAAGGAGLVGYTDSAPLLGAGTVQAAIDAVKALANGEMLSGDVIGSLLSNTVQTITGALGVVSVVASAFNAVGDLTVTAASGASLTLNASGADLNSMGFTRVNGDTLVHIDSGSGGRIQLNVGSLIAALDDSDGSWRVDVSGDAVTTAGGNITLTATNVVTISSTSQVTAITLTGYDIVFDSVRGYFRQNIPQVSFAPLLSGNDFGESVHVPSRQLKSDNSTVKIDWSGTDLALSAPGIISLTPVGNVVLNPTSGVIDCSGAALVNVGGGGTFLPNNGGATTNFTLTDSGIITLTAADHIELHSTSGGDYYSTAGGITNIVGTSNVVLTTSGNSFQTSFGGDMIATSTGQFVVNATGLNVTAGSSGYFLGAAGQSTLRVTGADLTIETVTSGNLAQNSAGTMTLSAGTDFQVYSSGTGYSFRSHQTAGSLYVDVGDVGGFFDYVRLYGGIGVQVQTGSFSAGSLNTITLGAFSSQLFAIGQGNTVNVSNCIGAGAIGSGCSVSGTAQDGSIALCQSTVNGGFAGCAVNQGLVSDTSGFAANNAQVGVGGVDAAAFGLATLSGARSFGTHAANDAGFADCCLIGLGAATGSVAGHTAIAGNLVTVNSGGAVNVTSATGISLTAFGGNLTLSSSADLTLTASGNITANGNPLFGVAASTKEKSETGSDANVLTYTAGAADEFMVLHVAIDDATFTGTSIVVAVAWRDSNNTARTSNVLSVTAVGGGSASFPLNVRTGTNVVVSTAFTGVSTAYKISASLSRTA